MAAPRRHRRRRRPPAGTPRRGRSPAFAFHARRVADTTQRQRRLARRYDQAPRTDEDGTTTASAVACTTEQTILGEGVRWDARRRELLRVDIVAGRLYRDAVGDDGGLEALRRYDLPGTVGAVAPIEGDDGWLVAFERGVSHLGLDGSLRPLAEFAPEGTRTNDAACDPQGRLWVGTKAHDNRRGAGALYRLDRDGGVELMLDGLTISNGLGWSPDGGTMYVIDTIPNVIHAFAFDESTGSISDGRVIVSVPEVDGGPDGMTVDSAGDLWVAMFGGGQVVRYAPDGTRRDALRIPAAQVTCCAFAGRDLRWLYVTTATEDWTDEQRRANPGAGLVYRVETDATGRPAEPFRPDPAWWQSAVAPG